MKINKKTAIIVCCVSSVLVLIIMCFGIREGKRIRESSDELHSDNVAEKLISFGFTKETAEEYAVVFKNVGITSISNLKKGVGDDDLRSYTCSIYDSKTITLVFTIERGRLIYIELNGSQLEYGELNVVLYRNGVYWNRFDYENNIITKIQ